MKWFSRFTVRRLTLGAGLVKAQLLWAMYVGMTVDGSQGAVMGSLRWGIRRVRAAK